jgi:hypothetical protein
LDDWEGSYGVLNLIRDFASFGCPSVVIRIFVRSANLTDMQHGWSHVRLGCRSLINNVIIIWLFVGCSLAVRWKIERVAPYAFFLCRPRTELRKSGMAAVLSLQLCTTTACHCI